MSNIGAAADLVVEDRAGMPAFVPVAERTPSRRWAHRSSRRQSACGKSGDLPTEERIRCGSYADSLVLGSQQELLALLARERRGFSLWTDFPASTAAMATEKCDCRRGQVDHDLDLGIGQKLSTEQARATP